MLASISAQGALKDICGSGYEEHLEKVLEGTRMLSDMQQKAKHRPKCHH